MMTILSTRQTVTGARTRNLLLLCVTAVLLLAAIFGVGVDTSQPQSRLEPALVEKVDPVYPKDLKKRNIEGIVKATYIIDTDGRVIAVEATTDSRTEFRQAVEAALQQWRFEPPLMHGSAVRIERALEVRFERPDVHQDDSKDKAFTPFRKIAKTCVPCPCKKDPDYT